MKISWLRGWEGMKVGASTKQMTQLQQNKNKEQEQRTRTRARTRTTTRRRPESILILPSIASQNCTLITFSVINLAEFGGVCGQHFETGPRIIGPPPFFNMQYLF